MKNVLLVREGGREEQMGNRDNLGDGTYSVQHVPGHVGSSKENQINNMQITEVGAIGDSI